MPWSLNIHGRESCGLHVPFLPSYQLVLSLSRLNLVIRKVHFDHGVCHAGAIAAGRQVGWDSLGIFFSWSIFLIGGLRISNGKVIHHLRPLTLWKRQKFYNSHSNNSANSPYIAIEADIFTIKEKKKKEKEHHILICLTTKDDKTTKP